MILLRFGERSDLNLIVWIASLLMNFTQSPCISRYDMVRLAEIGFEGLQDTSDSVQSDSCWLYSYLFMNLDYNSNRDVVD
jgi:hypothetical protein